MYIFAHVNLKNCYLKNIFIMINIKQIYHETLKAIRQFPVEALLGLTFFILGCWSTIPTIQQETVLKINGVLLLSFQMLVLTYLLNKFSDVIGRLGRWFYWLSYFIYIPLLLTDLSQFEKGFGYGFTWLLALLMLVVGRRSWDNRRYASEVLHTITQAFFTGLIGGLLYVCTLLIWFSLVYIFDIKDDYRANMRISYFVIFMVIPLLFCSFESHESKKDELPKILTIIFNFIISPAIIVYAAIMYVYLITIVVNWQLPKGGVAYMVMAFILVTLLCILVQRVLKKRYYDWFFNHFTWISIAPLILFWTGTLYRIPQYGLTESRVYLLVAGCAMILFVIMLLREQWSNFRTMVLISCCAIVVFTYIPGISAKSIGYKAQLTRFNAYVVKLHLMDKNTHKLVTNIQSTGLKNNPTTKSQLSEVSNIYEYLSDAVGSDKMEKEYGECIFGDDEEENRSFTHGKSPSINVTWTDRDLDLGRYTILLADNSYLMDDQQGNDTITIRKYSTKTNDDKVILKFSLKKLINETNNMTETCKNHPERFLTAKNDSLLAVFNSMQMFFYDKNYRHLEIYTISDYHLYKKK